MAQFFCKVDDLSFNGDPELEHVDNTEKRAISYDLLEQQLVQQQKEDEEEELLHQHKRAWAEESDNEVVLPEFVQSHIDMHHQHHQAQQLHHQHHYQQQQPQEFQFYNSPPATSDYHPRQETLLKQLLPGHEDSSSTAIAQAQSLSSSFHLPDGGDLSAFHALMAQTVPHSEFPSLQQLNPRDDQQQRHAAPPGGHTVPSHWSAGQHSAAPAQLSSSPQQLLYLPPSSLV
jgi:hypothetical protein